MAGAEQNVPEESDNPKPARSASSLAQAWEATWPIVRRNWMLFIPLIGLLIACLIIPTNTNIATTDDWAYTRSVEILYWDIRLTMFPVVAATAVGQVLWGGLFAMVFGMHLWVMRLSTIVAVAIGAVALYAILRQLGVSRSRSTLGMALYLFNPLTFILAFSFMTDPHFASVMLLSLAFYVFGLRPGENKAWAIVAGSFFAGYAFWIRQQGALIPVGVGAYLLVTGQLWFNWVSVRRICQVVVLPAAMLLLYYAWLYWVNDVPDVQAGFLDRAKDYGWDGTWFLMRYLTYFEMVYLGFFLLPLTIAVMPTARAKLHNAIGYWAFGGWVVAIIVGFYYTMLVPRRMPYIGQFLGAGGFGPNDNPGPRKRLVEWLPFWDWLTFCSIIGALLLGFVLTRKLVGERKSPERAAAGLVAMVGVWQMIGVIAPSYQYIYRGGSLDRYILPLIPIVIALGFWAVRDMRLIQPVAWFGVGVFAVVSTMGTRDSLVYYDAIWDMADYANEMGVPDEKMDAGSGWDGYHLYTDMLEKGYKRNRSPGGSPWWIQFYARQTDSTYIVSTSPDWRPGYVVVMRKEYSQWLEEDPVYVYLLRKVDAPWPPVQEEGQ